MRLVPGSAARWPGVGAVRGFAGDELGHAVGPMLIEIAAVELIPSGLFFEAMVGAQIHNHGIRIELRGELARSTVRQCEDDNVMPVQHFGRGIFNDQLAKLGNMQAVLAIDSPTEEWPATQVMSKSGCAARMRNASPPA